MDHRREISFGHGKLRATRRLRGAVAFGFGKRHSGDDADGLPGRFGGTVSLGREPRHYDGADPERAQNPILDYRPRRPDYSRGQTSSASWKDRKSTRLNSSH